MNVLRWLAIGVILCVQVPVLLIGLLGVLAQWAFEGLYACEEVLRNNIRYARIERARRNLSRALGEGK